MDCLNTENNFDSENKIWSGGATCSSMFDENVSIGQSVLYVLSLNPEKVCQINADDGSKRTNGEIYQETLNIAFNLQKIGCSKGDVVAFVCKNSHELTSAFLAAQLLAAPANPLDVGISNDELIHIHRITKPKFIFCDDGVLDKVQKSLLQLQTNATVIVIGKKIPGLYHISDMLQDDTQAISLLMNPPMIDKHSCSLIICTSGTTGLPKAIELSHRVLQRRFCLRTFTYGVGSSDSIFSEQYIQYGWTWVLLFMGIFLGMKRIITSKMCTPDKFIEIVDKYSVSCIGKWSTEIQELLNCLSLTKPLSSIKFIMCAGSILTDDEFKKLQPFLPNATLCNVYGMTEVGYIATYITTMFKDIVHRGPQIPVGLLSAGVTAKIIDDDGNKLGVGEYGELCVKSETVFLGYHGNSKATREILDEDGWIHTGDIAYFNHEGLLFVTGRKKDIFMYRDFTIFPSEIEKILQNHAGVKQAVVVGKPHEIFKNLPAAVVVRSAGSSVTQEDLEKYIETKVDDHKRLRGGIFFVEELPSTASLKIKRNVLRNMVVELSK